MPNCPNSLRGMWFLHLQRLTCRWRSIQWRRLHSTARNSDGRFRIWLCTRPFRLLQPPSLFHRFIFLLHDLVDSAQVAPSRFAVSELLSWTFILLLLPPSPNVDYRPYISSIFISKSTGGKIQPEDSSGHLAVSARKRYVWFLGYPHRQMELTGSFGLSCISSMHTAGWFITSSITFLP